LPWKRRRASPYGRPSLGSRKPARGVFFARRWELVSNRREHYEVNMLAHLLQQILEKPEWAHKLTHRDFAALTPLIWEHVNPYGRFETRHQYPIAA
jgi:hypothetical protein